MKSKRWGSEWIREGQMRKGGTPAPREKVQVWFDLSISQSPHSQRADRPNAVLQPTYLRYCHRKYCTSREESGNATAHIAKNITYTFHSQFHVLARILHSYLKHKQCNVMNSLFDCNYCQRHCVQVHCDGLTEQWLALLAHHPGQLNLLTLVGREMSTG